MEAEIKYLKSLFLSLLSVCAVGSNCLGQEGSHLPPIDYDVLLILGIQSGLLTDHFTLGKCGPGVAPEWVADPCRLKSYVEEKASLEPKKEMLSLIKEDHRVLYFGEAHRDQKGKVFLKSHLEDLKEKGFSVLALEMFNVESQPTLDQYSSGKVTEDMLRETLWSDWKYELDEYINLIKEARRLGFKILAIDNRATVKTNDFVEDLSLRDQIMAKNIAAFLTENPPEKKVVVLSGALHVQRQLSQSSKILSQPEILYQSFGYSSLSITFQEKRGRFSKPLIQIYESTTLKPFVTPVFLQVKKEAAIILFP